MSIRIQKTFEALFAFEEIRGLFRESLPTGFDPAEEAAFLQKIAEVKAILADLEAGTGYTEGAQRLPARSTCGPGKRSPSTSSRSRQQAG